jgi:hypothetical protein
MELEAGTNNKITCQIYCVCKMYIDSELLNITVKNVWQI